MSIAGTIVTLGCIGVVLFFVLGFWMLIED